MATEDHHSVGLQSGDQDEHHEKTSVLQKVKARAKKFGDTLGIKRHGHDHDQNHEEEEEVDDDDDEVEEKPQVHVAPIHESTSPRKNLATGQEVNSGQSRINLGQNQPFQEGPHAPKDPFQAVSPPPPPPTYQQTKVSEPTNTVHESTSPRKNLATGQEVNSGQNQPFQEGPRAPKDPFQAVSPPPPTYQQTKVSEPTNTVHESTSPRRNLATDQEVNSGKSRINLDETQPMQEDPSQTVSHPPNYQTKVSDPTNAGGGGGIGPIIRSFEKMEVLDKPAEEKQESNTGTGSQDHFSPDLPSNEAKSTIPENPQSVPDETRQEKNVGEAAPHQSTYAEKISSATSAITDKAISAKNVVTTKLGYGGNKDAVGVGTETKERGEGEGAKSAAAGVGVVGYGRQISATVYEKVAETGSAVVSKVQGTGAAETGTEGGVKSSNKRPEKGVGVKGYLSEKLKPGEEDKALSEVISKALHKGKDEDESKQMGKVGESPEVAKQLGGTESEGSESTGSGIGSPGKGMVDRIRGTVGSWLGKTSPTTTGESHTSEEFHSPTTHHGGDEVGDNAAAGERKLQESTN